MKAVAYYVIFILITPFSEFSCHVVWGGVIPEETTPIMRERFHPGIKLICSDDSLIMGTSGPKPCYQYNIYIYILKGSQTFSHHCILLLILSCRVLCVLGRGELPRGLCVCVNGCFGVSGTGRRKVTNRALRWESHRKRQPENHVPGAGPGQRSLQDGEGLKILLISIAQLFCNLLLPLLLFFSRLPLSVASSHNVSR